MASALQKLFRKRLSKQQQQHQQQQQNPQDASQGRFERQRKGSTTFPAVLSASHDVHYLTVSSLNSPTSTDMPRGAEPSSSAGNLSSFRSQVALERAGSQNADHGHGRARSASTSATMMLRESSTGARSWRGSVFSDSHAFAVDQFGSMVRNDSFSEAGGPPSTTHTDDDDELENNLLYAGLIHNLGSTKHWSQAKVLLVPSIKALSNISEDLSQHEMYLSLHALTPSNLFKDQFEAISLPQTADATHPNVWSRFRLTATLELESHSVHVSIARTGGIHAKGKRLDRKLNVLSETTMYRSMPSQGGATVKTSPRKERVRIRVLVVDDLVVPPTLGSRRTSKPPSSIGSSKATATDANQRDCTAEDDHASSVTFPSRGQPEPAASMQADAYEHQPRDPCLVPASRHFFADYAFLLHPPAAVGPLRGPLTSSLATLERAAADFANAYVYVPGFDAYNVSRIRRGILARSWRAFEEARKANGEAGGEIDLATWLGSEARARLLLLLENVVMGHCHGKVYGSICMIRHDADDAFDSVLATYHDHNVTLSDLGLPRSALHGGVHTFDVAEAILACLGDPEEDLEYILMDKNLSTIQSMAAKGCLPTQANSFEMVSGWNHQRSRSRVRTPLDVLDVMQATLDEISKAFSKAGRANSRHERGAALGTDDLLPLLAYVLTRTAPRKLNSLLYYVRLFGLSDATSPKHNWALVTFETVVKYLSDDPLELCLGSEGHRVQERSTPSIRSVRSSIRSPSPGLIGSADMERTRSTGSRDQHERARRVSLPSSALMGTLSSGSGSHLSTSTRSVRQGVSSSSFIADDTLADDDGDTTLQTFKRPGAPASATPYKTKRPSLTTSTTDRPVEQAGQGSFDGHASRSASMHKRASSMSSELMIRPQIIVRAPNRARDSQTTILDRPLSPQEGHSDSRACSPMTVPLPSPTQNVDPRRRSVDSWATLGLLGGYRTTKKSDPQDRRPSLTSGEGQQQVGSPSSTTSHDAKSDGLRPTLGLLSASTSSSWLPLWASDWGAASRRPSQPGFERTNSGNRTYSRPASVVSQEMSTGTPALLPRTNSSRSISALGFPSLDSMPSLETHEASTLENDDHTIGSSPRDHSSILSSPSSVLSSGHHYDQATMKGNRGSWYAVDTSLSSLGSSGGNAPRGDRRGGKTRTRLLSTSAPSDPLPPRLNSEAANAMPALFARSSMSPANADREDMLSALRPKPDSSSSANNVPTIDAQAVPLLKHRSKSSDCPDLHLASKAMTEPAPGPVHANKLTYSSPQSQFANLHIPSPVDERADPISASPVTIRQ